MMSVIILVGYEIKIREIKTNTFSCDDICYGKNSLVYIHKE